MNPDIIPQGPLSLDQMNQVFEAYRAQQHLSGMMMLFSAIVAVLIGALMWSQRRTQEALDKQNAIVVDLVEKATASTVKTGEALVESRKSIKDLETEMRAAFAITAMEIRQLAQGGIP